MRSFGKTIDLVVVCIAIVFVPYISVFLTNLIKPLIQSLDTDGMFLWVSIHHIWQLLLTIIIMKVYFKSHLRDWGFNLNDKKDAIKIIGWFVVIFSLIEIIGAIAIYVIGGSVKEPIGYPISFKNIFGYYGFEGLLSGTGEEPLFRGFVMTILAQSWKGKLRIGKIDFSVAGIIAAILFTFAHTSTFPFKTFHFDTLQILHAFGLGLLYAVVFQKTKSLFIPIILHNVSNVIMISLPYILLLL